MYNVILTTNFPIIGIGLSRIVQETVPEETDFHKAPTLSQMEGLLAAADIKMLIFDLDILDFGTHGSACLKEFEKLIASYPTLKAIVLYEKMDLACFRWMYLHGIMGIIGKDSSRMDIETCIRKVYTGELYVSNELLVELIKMPWRKINGRKRNALVGAGLTERERLVANLLVKGKTNTQICAILRLHPSTVATFKKRVFNKLHVTSLIELERLNRSCYDRN